MGNRPGCPSNEDRKILEARVDTDRNGTSRSEGWGAIMRQVKHIDQRDLQT